MNEVTNLSIQTQNDLREKIEKENPFKNCNMDSQFDLDVTISMSYNGKEISFQYNDFYKIGVLLGVGKYEDYT